ncbi:glutathione S-transferase [Artemisia annua]|uniref:glutathione transferase n=1 Tax=Artemisia annua TaxID=35608 RepID=A0A2U1LB27_ARTAN|nr:glutathione S-transferase [Artemisia annua]
MKPQIFPQRSILISTFSKKYSDFYPHYALGLIIRIAVHIQLFLEMDEAVTCWAGSKSFTKSRLNDDFLNVLTELIRQDEDVTCWAGSKSFTKSRLNDDFLSVLTELIRQVVYVDEKMFVRAKVSSSSSLLGKGPVALDFGAGVIHKDALVPNITMSHSIEGRECETQHEFCETISATVFRAQEQTINQQPRPTEVVILQDSSRSRPCIWAAQKEFHRHGGQKKLQLYSDHRSSCSFRVRIALNLKGLDYEYKAVDLLKGEQNNPEFLKINPIGCVPALVDGDVVIADSFAILMYLEEKYPQHPLLPKDLEKRAINYQAANIISASVQPLQSLDVLKYIEEMVGPDAKLPWANKYGNKGFAGLDYEYKAVDLLKGEQNNPEFLKINPIGCVPALVDGDVVIADSFAILMYLEEKYPQHPLLPKDLEKRAINYQAANIISASVQPLQSLDVLKYIEEMVGPDAKLPWANKYGNKGFAALEKLLEKHAGKYATGDDVYLADVFLAPQVYGSILRLNLDVTLYPTVSRVHEAYMQLPAFQNALPENQPDYPSS